MPRAAKKVVNEAGDVADVHKSIPIAISIRKINRRGIIVEQIINQCRYIVDIDQTILIHIA